MKWREATLKDLVVLQRGFDITRDQQRAGDVPVISSSGITSFHDEAKVDGPGVIIGRKGSLGTTHYSEDPYWPHDTTLWSKDLKGNSARYIFYFLQTLGLQQFNVGNANPTLNRNHIHGLGIRIPPLDVQQRIADRLTAYDDLIENNRRRIRLLEESARLLYREWFVHLRFPGHEHVKRVDGVPDGWRRTPISTLFDTTSGGTPSRAHPEYFDGEINWVKTQELDERFIFVTEERISEEAVSKSAAKIFPAGTLLVSIYGGTNIGRTALLAEDSASNQACVALLPRRNKFDVLFAQQWIQSNRQYLIGLAQGAAQTNISQQTLKSLDMLIPSHRLLNDFLERVLPSYELIKNLCRYNRQLVSARDLLLPRLMSGEISV